MATFKEQLNICKQVIEDVCKTINLQHFTAEQINYTYLYNELYKLIPLIPNSLAIYRDRFRDTILPKLKLPDIPLTDAFGRLVLTPQNGINPFMFGEAIATISYLSKESSLEQEDSLWTAIHPRIKELSKKRFEDGYYADAVEAAFKEINVQVKKIYRGQTGEEKDGTSLMRSAFSPANPIVKLGDITTEMGKNIQQGYMEMFAGAMMGIRNPKAHDNQAISYEDAMRKLHFASMLMYKIDNRLQ